MSRSLRIIAGLGVVLLCAPGAWAQGCILCYTSAAATGPGGMHAFQMAMFALLIPALLLFLAVGFLIFRRARAASAPAGSVARKSASRWASASRLTPVRPVTGRV